MNRKEQTKELDQSVAKWRAGDGFKRNVSARSYLVGAVSAWILASANGAIAQGYYVGTEVGHERVSFPAEYSFVSGAPNRTFNDKANGSSGSVLAGYRWNSTPAFSVALQGRLSANNAAWQMYLPAEPASFRYAVPVTATVSLLPSFKIAEHVELFAEAGVALGKIEERKSAVTTSMYDVTKWQPGSVAGLGLSYIIDDHWSLRISERRTWYKTLSYATHLANGTQVESVSSPVTQRTTSIGLIWAF